MTDLRLEGDIAGMEAALDRAHVMMRGAVRALLTSGDPEPLVAAMEAFQANVVRLGELNATYTGRRMLADAGVAPAPPPTRQ